MTRDSRSCSGNYRERQLAEGSKAALVILNANSNMPDAERATKGTRIVIAGGGFAGLFAAKCFDKHLARRHWLTFVIASGEFSGAVNDFLRETAEVLSATSRERRTRSGRNPRRSN